MRELESKDISFLKSGCLFVAHILAELHISYINLQKQKDLVHIEYSNQQQ